MRASTGDAVAVQRGVPREAGQRVKEVNPSALALAGSLAASAAAAVVGGLGSRRAPEVYGSLDKPSWAPPAAVFAPVWTVLYASMGVAAWRLWRTGTAPERRWRCMRRSSC